MSGENIRRYTADEIRAMIARGEDQTDRARIDAMTEEELEASIADDPDWKDIAPDWYKDAVLVNPGPKKQVTLRLDPTTIAHFRGEGRFWQTRINAVLQAYVRAAKKRTG